MTAKVILNPFANLWGALERKDEVEQALKAAGIDYHLEITTGPDHGIELAAKAIEEGYQPIISAGGDGSISEVVNGIVQANQDEVKVSLGIMPLGTANDFVINLGLPKTLNEAASIIAAGKTRKLDLAKITFSDPQKFRYFDNNSAIGLEPTITLISRRITRIRGTVRYLAATLRGVMLNPTWDVHLEWDSGVYDGPVTLVTVGNNPLTGGLFYMTPHADPFDGFLTFVYAYMPTRRQILRLLPRTMKPDTGNYVEHPSVHEVHSTWLKIKSKQPTPLHADGEIQAEAEHMIEYHILPGKLSLLMP